MAACSAGFFRTTATTYPSQQDLALFGELVNVGVREGLRVYTKWIKMMAISEMLERSLRPSCIILCATVFGSHSYEIWWCREIKSPPPSIRSTTVPCHAGKTLPWRFLPVSNQAYGFQHLDFSSRWEMNRSHRRLSHHWPSERGSV